MNMGARLCACMLATCANSQYAYVATLKVQIMQWMCAQCKMQGSITDEAFDGCKPVCHRCGACGALGDMKCLCGGYVPVCCAEVNTYC